MSKKPEKPETRKAAAAKRAATNQASSEPNREISKIRCMLSRLRFLEADANYRAEEAETDDESERLMAVHAAENHKIMKALRILIPRDFSELSELLRYVLDEIKVADALRGDDADIDILTNIVESLPAVIGLESEAGRRMGMTYMRDFLSRRTGAAFDVAKDPKAMERIQCGNTAWDNA